MTKEDILLSVVIPVYKAEKYLDECVESIISNKENKIELILVDDGSPDNCPKICDEWAKKDKRVKCIHQKNSGPSFARNQGVNSAKGKYLTFIDSDDKLFDGAIDKVVSYLADENNSFDLCFMNINKFYDEENIQENSDKISQENVKGKSKQEVVKYLSSREKFPGSPCSKLYSTEFLINNKICFPDDDRRAEDLGFVIDCIRYADKFDSLDFDYYLYRQQQEETRSNTISNAVIKGIELFVKESIEKFCENKKPRNDTGKYLMSFVAYEFQILMYFYHKANITNTEFLKENKWVLKFGRSIKSRVIFLMSKMFGLKFTSKIITKIKG